MLHYQQVLQDLGACLRHTRHRIQKTAKRRCIDNLTGIPLHFEDHSTWLKSRRASEQLASPMSALRRSTRPWLWSCTSDNDCDDWLPMDAGSIRMIRMTTWGKLLEDWITNDIKHGREWASCTNFTIGCTATTTTRLTDGEQQCPTNSTTTLYSCSRHGPYSTYCIYQ